MALISHERYQTDISRAHRHEPRTKPVHLLVLIRVRQVQRTSILRKLPQTPYCDRQGYHGAQEVHTRPFDLDDRVDQSFWRLAGLPLRDNSYAHSLATLVKLNAGLSKGAPNCR
jgi:hypothetical protein